MWPVKCVECEKLQCRIEHLEILVQLKDEELSRAIEQLNRVWSVYIDNLENNQKKIKNLEI